MRGGNGLNGGSEMEWRGCGALFGLYMVKESLNIFAEVGVRLLGRVNSWRVALEAKIYNWRSGIGCCNGSSIYQGELKKKKSGNK